MSDRLLIAGIGNIFFGDDAFGSEVARALMKMPWPAGVRVEDFGIRGYDLAYALMEGTPALLLDVVSRGESPGTLYLIELDPAEAGRSETMPDAHSLDPVTVLQMVHALGGETGPLWLLGCEPDALEDENGALGLSAPAEAAVEPALLRVKSFVGDFLAQRSPVLKEVS
jgi:hydrogenase maturation protease